MPSIAVHPATVPVDFPFPPANAQALINFVAAYLQLNGVESLTGVVTATTAPAAADRDKVWLKKDAVSGRVLGFYAFTSGEWTSVPAIVSPGEADPANPKTGELSFNSTIAALRIYNGAAWTTNFRHTGPTASRPTGVPTGYQYFDTDVGALLRRESAGWTTDAGSVGDVKMVMGLDEAAALTRNPGWSVVPDMAGRFPLGASESIPRDTVGGKLLEELKLEWTAQGRSGSGGERAANASFLAALTLNGVEARADGSAYPALTKIGTDHTIDLTPPHRAFLFLKKDF